MAGIEDRVKEFLETWERRKAAEIPSTEPARCRNCGVVLKDGKVALVDSGQICLNCMKSFQEK